MNGIMRTCMARIAIAATCTTIGAQQATPTAPELTLAEAEHLAIEHNPRINIARLLQLAQAQVVREVRSSELPGASANLTAVDSHNGSRITAGGLNNPIVYERAAGGVTIRPTDHRLWAHSQPGFERAGTGQGTTSGAARHHRGHHAGRRPGFLQCPGQPGGPQGCGADGGRAPGHGRRD